MIHNINGEAVAEVLLRMPTVTLLPYGRSHRSEGMLADSKCANWCISEKVRKVILNCIQRLSRNWGRWQAWGRNYMFFKTRMRLQHANNMPHPSCYTPCDYG